MQQMTDQEQRLCDWIPWKDIRALDDYIYDIISLFTLNPFDFASNHLLGHRENKTKCTDDWNE